MKTKRQHPRWTTTKKTRKRVSKTTMREKPVIKEFKELLLTQLNSILSQAPDFNTTLSVGTPISALLVWTMGSSYGFDAYRRVRINAMFKKILAVYKKFLDSPESRYVLTDKPNGWFSPAALKKLDINQYIHDPKAKYFGFKSWNDFFTRRLKPGMRPIADPDDNKVIVSACDSTVYRIRHNVKRFSKFWLSLSEEQFIKPS
jgi:phosphatidylserine decarboxylase